ncbi:hypothetical protein BWD121_011660 [Bartonella sp. WD12.1]|nr:hypothetical protein BWD121_011660 [Bartonella sp. WD12.1]
MQKSKNDSAPTAVLTDTTPVVSSDTKTSLADADLVNAELKDADPTNVEDAVSSVKGKQADAPPTALSRLLSFVTHKANPSSCLVNQGGL